MKEKFLYLTIFLLIFFIFTQNSFANSIVNSPWRNLYAHPNSINIKKTFIEFRGVSKEEIYINGAKRGELSWKNSKEKIIKWSFRYTDEYVFMVSVLTEQGYRTIMYIPQDGDTTTYIGLGKETIDGKWHTVERNLQEDLQRTEPNNHILLINAFICRGKGDFGAIEMRSIEDTKEWKKLFSFSNNVSKVYDKEKKKEVVSFDDASGKISYIYRFSKEKTKHVTRLSWEFKYQKDFVILVSLFTKKGYKTLLYTSEKKSGKYHIGLGGSSIRKRWNFIERDLKKDLQRVDPDNEIVYLNAFIYKGEGRFTQLQVVENRKNYSKREVFEMLFLKMLPSEEENYISSCSTVPSLKLIGGDLVHLELHEPYIEKGFVAKDCTKNELSVTILGEVDTEKIGQNVLHYITTDESGNTRTLSRVIMVGLDGNETVDLDHNSIEIEDLNQEDIELESDGVDEAYEAIKKKIEEALLDIDYEIGDEIIINY